MDEWGWRSCCLETKRRAQHIISIKCRRESSLLPAQLTERANIRQTARSPHANSLPLLLSLDVLLGHVPRRIHGDIGADQHELCKEQAEDEIQLVMVESSAYCMSVRGDPLCSKLLSVLRIMAITNPMSTAAALLPSCQGSNALQAPSSDSSLPVLLLIMLRLLKRRRCT